MYPKAIFLPWNGVQNRETKTGDWEWLRHHFRTPSFAENRFLSHFLFVSRQEMSQKCIVYKKIKNCWRNLFSMKLEVPKCHKHSQFPVFWTHGFVPHGKWNFMFLVHQNKGKKNQNEIHFLLYLSVHCGDLITQIKKKSVIYTLRVSK